MSLADVHIPLHLQYLLYLLPEKHGAGERRGVGGIEAVAVGVVYVGPVASVYQIGHRLRHDSQHVVLESCTDLGRRQHYCSSFCSDLGDRGPC